ncbi:MAG: DNA polymerase IV [Anaerolineales bacterium]
MTRQILHLDLDAFFCAVEEINQPDLRGVPFAVGGSPDARGVVASCSYPARQFGVRSAMPMTQARRLCPELRIIRWSKGEYSAYSARVMAILHEITPQVEQLSIDEAFLDVTGEDGEARARALQARIRAEVGLPCSLGVATNKLVAKIANNIGKAAVKTGDYPNAITVVPPGQEAAFLAPLPTRELWGVGPKTAEKLAALGLDTIGDIATHSPDDLAARFGKHGADLARRARGEDNRPIVTTRERKSISRETTYPRDVNDPATLEATLHELTASVGERLRAKGLTGTTVKIKLRWSDFTTFTRQTTLPQPTDRDADILRAALRLLHDHRPPGRYVRLIGVGISNLAPPSDEPHQLGLWDAG